MTDRARVDMHSDAYRRFVKSMDLSYEDWHEGAGYGLAALAEIEGAERDEIERLLVDRLAGRAGEVGGLSDTPWREIEALAELGTASAMQAIRGALQSADPSTALRAAEELAARGEPIALDEYILRTLRAGVYGTVSHAFDLAATHATPVLRRGLLALALSGPHDVRVHAAALTLYLAGKAPEPFDWNQRPFFLRFGEEDRDAAFQELCEMVGNLEDTWK